MSKGSHTAIDLFAGCGGFSLGLRRGGFRILAAIENDKYAVATYRTNFPGVLVLEKDIRKVGVKELLKAANIKAGELELLVGGPPCQGFSIANTRRSLDDPRSKLMNEFIRLVRGIRPRVFMIENVPGMFYFKDFMVLLMATLERCGYVVRCLMMDAVSYGVPQYRKRIFIQGIRKALGMLPVFPPPTNFAPEQLRASKTKLFSRASVAIECFAINGFPKEDVKDLWWNSKLDIQMKRSTAAHVVNVAIRTVIAQGIKSALRIRRHDGQED